MSIIALTITRSLGRKGVPVIRLHPNPGDLSLQSRYTTRVMRCPDANTEGPELVDFLIRIAGSHAQRPVLIPASDDCAAFVAEHRSALSRCYAVCGPDPEAMSKVIDKRALIKHAMSQSIPIPETHFPEATADLREFAGSLKRFPYAIKPIVAHRWRLPSMQHLSKGRKAVVARTPDELALQLSTLLPEDPDLMVQEVVQGPDEQLYTYLAYLDSASTPVGYCIRRKIRQGPRGFGYCTMTETCDDRVVRELSERLLRSLSFRGMCGVEWKKDPVSGTPKLIEINGRAVNTIGIAGAAGVDLPYLAYRDTIGETLKPEKRAADGMVWLWFFQDLWVAREQMAEGELSRSDWLRSLRRKKVHAIFAWDDLGVSLRYLFRQLRRMAQSWIAARRPRLQSGT